MDKEREVFEAWLKSLNENGRTTYFLGQESTVAWEAWQAAKAQAVPEGYAVVPKQPTLKIIHAGEDVRHSKFIVVGNIYKAMIEVQENKG